MFPTEQTKVRKATTGPRSTFSIVCTGPGASVRKSALKNPIGRRATKPAMTKPPRISFQSISQSPRKLWATSDQAPTEVKRSRQERASEPTMWCWWPVSAAIACSRASSSTRRVISQRMPAHMETMRKIPPTNSARVNCQPRKIQRTIPISKTRFVEANWNAIAAAKLAPFWKRDLEIATAA
jgi:hypothetical protein